MITLDKKNKKLVDRAKQKIEALTIQQNDLFTLLCNQVGIQEDTAEAESLWDHVFNGTDWAIKFK